MKVQKVLDEAFDEEFGICKIVHLPSVVALSQALMQSVPDEFESFLDDSYGSRNHYSTAVLLSYFKQANDATFEDEDEDFGGESDLENLQLLSGSYTLLEECQFLVQFRTNKRTYHKNKNSWSSSAGWYCTQWIAAPTIAKAWTMGLNWAKDMHKEDFEESKKEQP